MSSSNLATYNLKLALQSFRRAPLLYLLIMLTLSVGIGLLCANLALVNVMTGNPLENKSEQVFHISMNTWANETPDVQPFHLIRYRDAKAITESSVPSHSAVFYESSIYARDANAKDLTRHSARVRATTSGFFALTDAPFAYGTQFTDNASKEVVISDSLNTTLYGGGNNVGKTLELGGELFTITGILKPWNLRPKFYHATENRAFDKIDDIYAPLETALDLNWLAQARTSSTDQWQKMPETRDRNVFYMHAWVQLDTQQQQDEFQQFLDSYSQSLKDAGEHPLDINNELHTVTQWLEKQDIVDDKILAFTIASALFLAVCVFNASSLFLSRFHAGKFEVGLRRAIGASKRHIFWQGVVESTLLGVITSALALGLSSLFLIMSVEMLPHLRNLAQLDGDTLIYGVVLSILATNLSALYSLYRANRYTISAELK